MTREEKLMIRIGQGDMDAVDELIGLLYPEILRYCLWHAPNRGLAEDAAQETFLKVIRYYDRYVHKGKGQMLRSVQLPCLKRYCWPGRRRTPGGSGFPSHNSYPCRFALLAGRSGRCRLLICLRSAVCFPICLDRDIGKTPNPLQGCWSVCPFSPL